MALKAYKFAIPSGISPSNKLSDKSRDCSPLKYHNPDGNSLERPFDEKLTTESDIQKLKEPGIIPVRSFLANETDLNDPHCWKNPSGIDPDRPFSLKSITCKPPSLGRSGFIVPLKLLLAKDKT
jgi:hypothetical protein